MRVLRRCTEKWPPRAPLVAPSLAFGAAALRYLEQSPLPYHLRDWESRDWRGPPRKLLADPLAVARERRMGEYNTLDRRGITEVSLDARYVPSGPSASLQKALACIPEHMVEQAYLQWTEVQTFPDKWKKLLRSVSDAKHALSYTGLIFQVMEKLESSSKAVLLIDSTHYQRVRDVVLDSIARNLDAESLQEFKRLVEAPSTFQRSLWDNSDFLAAARAVVGHLKNPTGPKQPAGGLLKGVVRDAFLSDDVLEAQKVIQTSLTEAKQAVASLPPQSHFLTSLYPYDAQAWRFFVHQLYMKDGDEANHRALLHQRWKCIEELKEICADAESASVASQRMLRALAHGLSEVSSSAGTGDVPAEYVRLWMDAFLTNFGMALAESGAVSAFNEVTRSVLATQLAPYAFADQRKHPQKDYAAFRAIKDATDFNRLRNAFQRPSPHTRDNLYGMKDDDQRLAWARRRLGASRSCARLHARRSTKRACLLRQEEKLTNIRNITPSREQRRPSITLTPKQRRKSMKINIRTGGDA